MLFTAGSAFMRTSPAPVVQRTFPRACFRQVLLHPACSALSTVASPPPPSSRCKPSKVLQSLSLLLGGRCKSLPCLGGARRKPGKGTPVRVGNLPMKWECVHTKALTPGGDHNSQRQHRTFQPKTTDNIVFRSSKPFEPFVNLSLLVFC